MQDMCRCRIVPASALPKVLICTLQTMRHWGRLQWGERRGGVVLLCYGDIYYAESRRQGAAWLTGQGGGWWQFLLLLFHPLLSCSPPPALLPLSPGHRSHGASSPWIQLQGYNRCKHFSVSQLPYSVWTRETMPMHRNVECECALESFDRKDGTSTFPIIWKLFRILNFDIIFNSSGIKQVGHIEYDKICKIASIPYYI